LKEILVKFTNNKALQDGGTIYLNDQSNFTHINNSNVSFYHNIAGEYGGAIYALLKECSINFNGSDIYSKAEA